MKSFYLFIISFCISFCAYAQKPQFKVTERDKPTTCGGRGCSYIKGYVNAPHKGEVIIAMYVQHESGYWERKEYVKDGSGYVDLSLSDCKYTGNYYAYACYKSDTECKFPEDIEIEKMHNGKDQTPKFKLSDPEKTKCPDGTGQQNITFKSGYVYSPTGGQVEITIFFEKTDGKWRKKHLLYYGTGMVDIDASGCDLTGNYKAIVQYTN